VSCNLKLNRTLEDRSLSMRDKSMLYFAGVCTAVLDVYMRQLIADPSSSTHLSARSPPPNQRARLTCDERDECFDHPSSEDPFCASSGTGQSFVQSWSNPAFNAFGMEGSFSVTTPKVVYEPESPGAQIGEPFGMTHNMHITPEMLNGVQPLLNPVADLISTRRGERRID
jgi:hypothetical protein